MFAPTLEKYRDRVLKGKGKLRDTQRMEKSDALPTREKMGVGSYRRVYSGNIHQIRRWLGNQVGRPWDVVHSELSAMAPKNSLEREHLMLTVTNAVEVDVIEENGVLLTSDRFQRTEVHPGSLYVLNGVLCRLPYNKASKPTRTLRVTFTGQMEGVGISNGQWFAVTFKELADSWDRTHDVFLREQVGVADVVAAYGKAVVAVAKRAMSKREILKFKASR